MVKTNHLYYWLIRSKKYSTAEAKETIIRLDCDMDLPDQILQDVKEYQKQMNDNNPNTLF